MIQMLRNALSLNSQMPPPIDDGWIGFDLDGTLAFYDGWQGVEHIGRPIAPMVELLKSYLDRGVEVRIFTARVSHGDKATNQKAVAAIQKWCMEEIGVVLRVTCIKDFKMKKLYDDRARQVVENEGRVVEEA